MLSDIEMFTLIASNPRDWLWSVRVQVEMFALLPKLWQRLDMTRRDELARIIIAGPPRDLYRSSLSEREWTEIRDHAIWARLSRIKRCDPGLRGVPLEGLERLEESYRWKLSGEQRDDFPLWMENNLGVRQGQRAEYLSKLSNDELVPILLTVRDRYDDTLEWWGAFVSEAPARGLTILTKLRTRGRVNLQVWSTALWSVQRLEERELKLRACELVRELSPRIRGKLLREIAGVIRGVSTKCDEGLRQTVIDTWDRVVATALGMKASSDREILSEALNHPAGVMAEALFEILRSGNLARNQGITQDIRKRLSRLSRSKGDGAPLARAIICSRLPLLHDLDPGWTVRYAIPLFDWGKPREAAGAWQGFLWSPLIRP